MTERRQVTPAGVLFRSHGPIHRKNHAGIVGLTVWEILTQRRRGGLLSLLGVLEFGRWVLQGAPSRSDGAMKSEKVAREAARMDLYGCGHSARCAPFASAIPTLWRDGTSRRSFCSDRRSISNRLVNEAPFNDDSQASEAMNNGAREARGVTRMPLSLFAGFRLRRVS